ncbi:MAG TPA: chemotaxis protein CheW [Sphingomonadaceae bacterium]|nr:chemotaxis protein CheW [Sphingomonadaceae bacterium]
MNDLYLIVGLCGEKVAFRAAEVQSVIELDRVTPAPRAPDFIAGLTALRSRALTVVDCTKSLELGQGERELEGCQAAVVEHQGHIYALALDAVDDVVEAQASPEPVPAKLAGGWHRVAQGMVETELGPMLVVDLAALIAGPEQKKAA